MAGLFLFCAVFGVLSQEVLISQAEVISKNVSHENLKFWTNPDDGVLATENTPVYGIRKKETPEGTPTEYEFVEYLNGMKEVADYLRATNPGILLESTYDSSHNEEESSSESSKIVYPEILVIIDYAYYQKFNYTFYDAVEFTLAFWTGVDIKFRNLEKPKVRLNIAGILLIEHPDAISYEKISENKIHALNSVDTVGKWLYKYKVFLPIESYDFAVVLTGLQLGGSDTEKIHTHVGYFGQACRAYDSIERVNKVVLISSPNGFDKIQSVTTQIASMLGVDIYNRDGKCPKNKFELYNWTQCTLDQFSQSLSGDGFDCVKNKPKEGKPVPRILPGKLKSLDQQCSFIAKNHHGKVVDHDCDILFCKSEVDDHSFWTLYGASAGSPCGDGKICLQGKCIEE